MIESGERRIPGLDGIRGIAILLVLLFHAAALFAGRDAGSFDSILLKALGGGWMGVNLFFVLSGFLITGILVDTKARADYFRSFYIRRALRIFPIYFVFIAALVLMPALHLSESSFDWMREKQLWFWSYLPNFLFMRGWGPTESVSHLWSLAIEEQYYLVWPLLVFALETKSLIRLCAMVIGAVVVFRPIILWTGGFDETSMYLHTLTRIDAVLFGSLLALVTRAGHGPRVERILPSVTIAGSALIVAGAALERGFDPFGKFTMIFTQTGIFLVSGLLVWRSAHMQNNLVRLAGLKPLLLLGKYSYAIYIFHWPIFLWAGKPLVTRLLEMTGGSIPASVVLFLTVAIPGMLAVGALSWVLIESRFLNMKERFAPR